MIICMSIIIIEIGTLLAPALDIDKLMILNITLPCSAP